MARSRSNKLKTKKKYAKQLHTFTKASNGSMYTLL